MKKKVFTTAKKSKYEGEWVEEFGKHGKGKLKYPDGDMYQGEWLKDKRHGYGVYIWSRYIFINKPRTCGSNFHSCVVVILTVGNGFTESDMEKAHTLHLVATTTPVPGRTTRGTAKASG